MLVLSRGAAVSAGLNGLGRSPKFESKKISDDAVVSFHEVASESGSRNVYVAPSVSRAATPESVGAVHPSATTLLPNGWKPRLRIVRPTSFHVERRSPLMRTPLAVPVPTSMSSSYVASRRWLGASNRER